jgi:hypothetical protein
MFKELLIRKLISSKLGHLPKEDQDRIVKVVTKNPELFQEIATKIKVKTDAGADQMMATMTVMKEYQGRLQKLMTES